MKEWLDQFLSDFHRAYLKKLGFKKVRRTFSRDMGSHWERFNFQGSTSNYPDHDDWRFYLNVGVEFTDLEPGRNWSYFPHTHWAGRMETVVSSAPSAWTYKPNTDRERLMRELASHILKASQKMAAEAAGLRNYYLEGQHLRKRYPFDEI